MMCSNCLPTSGTRKPSGRRNVKTSDITATVFFIVIAIAGIPDHSVADESGVGFWQVGTYDSLAATPNQPGWSLTMNTYNGASFAGNSVASAQLIRIGAIDPTLRAQVSAHSKGYDDNVTISPSYLFATPVLGAQAALSVSTTVGHSTSDVFGTLGGLGANGFARRLTFNIGDSVTGFGDLNPQVTLYWNSGVHNFLVYGTGDIPVGEYHKFALANLGIGHGAADVGGGYTYLNYDTGYEFSAVAGFTYNLKSTSTNYQNGVDFHLDFGASKYLNDNLFIGPVGYFYEEIGCDSGSGDKVGCFNSRVAGLGGQIGYSFPIEGLQGYLNLKGYGEFAADNRAPGWNVRLTFSLSPPLPASTSKGSNMYK